MPKRKYGVEIRYPQDCRAICRAAMKHGLCLTVGEAQELWEEVSEEYSAGWLGLPDTPSELWEMIEEINS